MGLKKYKLLIQKVRVDTPFGEATKYFFGIVEADKNYPESFVCNLPSNPEHLLSRAYAKKYGLSLMGGNPTDFAVGLLVDAYNNHKDPETKNEIMRRLRIIWKEK